MPVVFFDIGDTLATPILSHDDRLEGFTVFPEVIPTLEELQSRSIRMGVISNAGNEDPANVNSALEECGLLHFFDPDLLIYRKKDSAKVFSDAAALANVTPDECVFVGENSKERSLAMDAGFRVSPHPSLTLDVLDGIALVYARVKLLTQEHVHKWSDIRQSLQIVPLRVTGESPQSIYVIASLRTADVLHASQIEVEVLGDRDQPLRSDLYLVRDDRSVPSGFASSASYSTNFLAEQNMSELVLAQSAEGVFLAVPADMSIETVHFPEAQHGHNEKLIADVSLLNSTEPQASFTSEALLASFAPTLSDEELEKLKEISASTLVQYHQPYAGQIPLEGGTTIVSRHIKHADNRRVVEALLRHFSEIGGADIAVRRHRFQHENLFLYNVVAEFPGTEPDSLVLVTAHLDSTAAFSGGPYDAAHDAAPGADDDASGIAAVLVIAKIVADLYATRKPKRTIRFVLFNAEEHGLVGSKAYARSQAAAQANITAVFQMDMIGYRGTHSAPPRDYEIHAGYPVSADVESRSLALAEIIKRSAANVAPSLNAPQIYPDRDLGLDDPAAGRSDHASFNERGYAACVLSEDFFAGPKEDSPEAEPNPDYHKRTDTTIDYNYAADIARVVAAAALLAANA